MALTQRLQIRQSQALVMTPQLMQAIKLLQLSNLDLVAYVEAELERNPLLDRSADDEHGPVEAAADAPAGPAAEAEAWDANPAEPSRSAMEDALDARADDVFPEAAEPSPPRTAEGPAAYSEWAAVGAGGRDDACRLAARAIGARGERAGAADDRPVLDRSGGRVRLRQRRS
jgi:RNA polymerase sigma-54 factor